VVNNQLISRPFALNVRDVVVGCFYGVLRAARKRSQCWRAAMAAVESALWPKTFADGVIEAVQQAR